MLQSPPQTTEIEFSRFFYCFILHFYKIAILVSAIVNYFGLIQHIVKALTFVGVFRNAAIVVFAIIVIIGSHPLRVVGAHHT